MTPTTFPLSKRRGRCLKYGSAFRWRLIKFKADGLVCRLLIGFNAAKETYLATLAVEEDRDMRVVLAYEFHGTHPGWHVHTTCGDIAAIPEGSLRGAWQKRIPAARTRHRRSAFDCRDENAAFQIAETFFGLRKGDGAML